MRIAARIGHIDVIILVDSSSTHNFVDSKLVKRGNFAVEPTNIIEIMVADAGILYTRGRCQAI